MLSVVEFAESRAQELEAMSRVSAVKWNNRNINQIVPPHMRRRAAGHNVKRLPRRLREAAIRSVRMNFVVMLYNCVILCA